jgi:hypothetical protein
MFSLPAIFKEKEEYFLIFFVTLRNILSKMKIMFS